MKKRCLSMLLALVMVLSLMPATAFADAAEPEADVADTLISGEEAAEKETPARDAAFEETDTAAAEEDASEKEAEDIEEDTLSVNLLGEPAPENTDEELAKAKADAVEKIGAYTSEYTGAHVEFFQAMIDACVTVQEVREALDYAVQVLRYDNAAGEACKEIDAAATEENADIAADGKNRIGLADTYVEVEAIRDETLLLMSCKRVRITKEDITDSKSGDASIGGIKLACLNGAKLECIPGEGFRLEGGSEPSFAFSLENSGEIAAIRTGGGSFSGEGWNGADWITTSGAQATVYANADGTAAVTSIEVFYKEIVRGPVPYVYYTEAGNSAVRHEDGLCAEYELVKSDTASFEDGFYVAEGEVTVPERITVRGNVHLILTDGCSLTAEKGIAVPEGSSLTICGQSGDTGKLTAKSVYNCAAIGGNEDSSTGSIVISGGEIHATADNFSNGGAAIGAACAYRRVVTAEGITINGGKVFAVTNGYGAAIGGGYAFDTGAVNTINSITINGGTVNAVAKAYGPAIGSGYAFKDNAVSTAKSITINGGVIQASASADGAAIGSGFAYMGTAKSRVEVLVINGGEVYASSTGESHAVGSGRSFLGGTSSVQSITINSGTVTAQSAQTTAVGIEDPCSDGYVCAKYGNSETDITGEREMLTDDELTAILSEAKYVYLYTIAVIPYLERNYADGGVQETEKTVRDYQVITSSVSEFETGFYVAEGDVTVSERIAVRGNVHLILTNGCSLTVPRGIEVPQGSSLTICGQKGDTGKLTSKNHLDDAAIGGNYNGSTGTITIMGGTVDASAGGGCAAIGGGYASGAEINVNSITINGGTVNATTNGRGAAIGSGEAFQKHAANTVGYIIINGGTVNATSTSNGAAIGTGCCNGEADECKVKGITINGGTVTAVTTSRSNAAAIGSGYASSGSTAVESITVNGGTVHASSQGDACAIGYGLWGSVGSFVYSNGTVIAESVNKDAIGADSVESTDRCNRIKYGSSENDIVGEADCMSENIKNEIKGQKYAYCYRASSAPTVTYVERAYKDGKITATVKTLEDFVAVTSGTSVFEDGKYYVVVKDTYIQEGIQVNGNANLILKDGCSLTFGGNGIRSLIVNSGNTLNIYGQLENTGVLNANKGIGGRHGTSWGGGESDNGAVYIHGGTVNASGEGASSGIGGGERANANSSEPIVIYGGIVNVTAQSGAAIGGPSVIAKAAEGSYISHPDSVPIAGNGGRVEFYGGELTAFSGEGSAVGPGKYDVVEWVNGFGVVTPEYVFGYPATVYIAPGLSVCYGDNADSATNVLTNSMGTDSLKGAILRNQHYVTFRDDGIVHVWQEATCLEPMTCVVCGATEGTALGHSFPEMAEKVDAEQHRQECSRCHMEVAAPHVWDKVEYKPIDEWSDCRVFTCTACGETRSENLPALPYTYYTTDGNTAVKHDGACEKQKVVTSDTTALEDGKWYAVYGDVTVNGRITVSGTVNLILKDDAALTAVKGIRVAAGSTLNIYSQSGGSGILNASGEFNKAAIGGDNGGTCGTINIHGGAITATAAEYGAGIGGGEKGSGGAVTVYSGTVAATGGLMAAGIGGGDNGVGGSVTVYGGTVTANGGRYGGAGIGGGFKSDGGSVAVYGGRVIATGTEKAAGVGQGDGGSGNGTLTLGSGLTFAAGSREDDITVSGDNGNVGEAQGLPYFRTPFELPHVHSWSADWSHNDTAHWHPCASDGCDITDYSTVEESGYEAHSYGTEGTAAFTCAVCGAVNVTREPPISYVEYAPDGTETEKTCTAYEPFSDTLTALEDGKWYVVYGDVTVNDRITADGTVNIILKNGVTLNAKAGIEVGSGGTLNIFAEVPEDGKETGKLIASGDADNAGIGCSGEAALNIHGGDITAAGGSGAAGIGGGKGESGGTINIYDGTVTAGGAAADKPYESGAGIGGGLNGSGGTVTIYGGTITAQGGPGAAGIGAGSYKYGDRVTINGGNVTAIGGNYDATDNFSGAGIGGGCALGDTYDDSQGGGGGIITINGGIINASSDGFAAGIGAGKGRVNDPEFDKITINNAEKVVAEGGRSVGSAAGMDQPNSGLSLGGDMSFRAGYNADDIKWTSEEGDSVFLAFKEQYFEATGQHVHVFNQRVINEKFVKSEASCTEAAVYYKSCTCGEASETDTFTSGTALGHKWQDASCTTPKTCSVCKATEGEAPGHKWNDGEVTRAATHTAAGEKTYTCSVCRETKTELIEKLPGHTFDKEAAEEKYLKSEATCTDAAVYFKSCECGEASTTETFTSGDPIDHSFPDTWEQYNAEQHKHTCTACGKETEYADHAFDGNTCKDCGYVKGSTYNIIAGANGEWTKGSTEGYLVTSDAPFSKFVSVKVDGAEIEAVNYTAVEGSTKITLAPAYLEGLTAEGHTIEIVSNDGSASTSFTVKNAPAPASYTVTFSMNGHGVAPAKQTVQEGGKAAKPANPTAVGYTFNGWYADAGCTVKYNFDSAVTADTVIYAKWTQNSVTPVKPDNPRTGDDSRLLLWSVVMLAGCGVLAGMVISGRKKKKN